MIEFMSEHLIAFVVGAVIAAAVSVFAYQKQALSRSGMYAAIVMGITVTVCGGYMFMGAMLVFFGTSSVLGKLHKGQERYPRRTYIQVFANGGVAMVVSIIYAITNDAMYQLLFFVSIAASTADTWASEIGTTANQRPRHIIRWTQLNTGQNGGITLRGVGASLAGSIVISLFYQLHLMVIIGGFIGSIVDSILGTIQVRYILENGEVVDNIEENQPFQTKKGLAFLSNSLVNVCSNVIVVTGVFLSIQFLQ